MKKKLTLLLFMLLTVSLTFGLASCRTTPAGDGKYTLTYTKGAYLAEGTVPEAKRYAEGEEVILAEEPELTFEGYCFAGWTDGSQDYEAGSAYTMPAHDVTMAAKWVEGDPQDPQFAAAGVGFNDGDFVLTGTVKNAEKLYVYLINTYHASTADNYVEATISDDGSFEARLPLAQLVTKVGKETSDPFNVRYKFDDLSADIHGVKPGNLDLTATASHDGHDFRIAVNSGSGDVAVYFAQTPSPEEPEFTAESVGFNDGDFVLTGTVKNAEKLYVYLINTYHASTADNYVEATISDDGSFEARLPLAQLVTKVGKETSDPFNVRYKFDDLSADIHGVKPGNLDLTATASHDGHDFRIAVNSGSGDVAVYFAQTPSPEDPDTAFAVTDMRFEDGKFVVEGTCGADVETLVFHLNNTTNPAFDKTFDAAITDGTFKAEILLSEIKRADGSDAPKSYINVRYAINGATTLSNILPGKNGNAAFATNVDYTFEERKWTLKADSSRTYLNWAAAT